MTDDATPRDAGERAGDAPATPPVDADTLTDEAAAGRRLATHAEGDADVVAAPKPVFRPAYPFLIIVALTTLAADLGSKWWAKDRLEAPKSISLRKIEVVKDHFNLILAKNHGGAWGILGDESEAIRRPFFLLISLAAIVFIVSLFRKLHPAQRALKWGLPLVLGGALGNLVDRVRYGFVVDFIQVRFTPSFVWPTFNIADVAIVVGVGLMAIDMFVPHRPERMTGTTGTATDVAVTEEKASAGKG